MLKRRCVQPPWGDKPVLGHRDVQRESAFPGESLAPVTLLLPRAEFCQGVQASLLHDDISFCN